MTLCTSFPEMPFGLPTTRLAWELKVLGLAVILGYALYKFAWSYRLFNYAAILIGAVAPTTIPHWTRRTPRRQPT